MEKAPIIPQLIIKYLQDELTAAEQVQLDEWLAADPENRALLNEFKDAETLENYLINYGSIDTDAVRNKIAGGFAFDDNIRTVHRMHFLRRGFLKYAAAILIIAGVGAYLWNNQTDKKKTSSAEAQSAKVDVLPGSNKALLTLSDGQKIALNNNTAETIQDGNLSIKNNNGQLIYASNSLPIPSNGGVDPTAENPGKNNSGVGAGVGRGESLFNTMSTPRGGQYQLTLPDGTRIWLNAASSITYPTTFTANKREVSITGEAYLEVSPNKSKPFIVNVKGKPSIEVLGTSFNVNAYSDEPGSVTTLLDGSIKISTSILKPGQQAHILQGNKINISGNADVEKVLAWKNGRFNFDNVNVEEAMRQISRWYDIEVAYEKPAPDIHFFGKISRDVPLSTVLKAIEKAGVKFIIRDKKLVVQ